MSITSFHIAYNARHKRPEDVAKTFIYSSDFEELIQDNHTVLLGARGCGKTTLMKMLTLPALNSWAGAEAQDIRNNISFFPIYISTDIYWNAQKDSYNDQLEKFPKYADVVSKVAVTTNVLYALCEAFQDILKHKSLENDETNEIELSKFLIEKWFLTPTIPNIRMVKEALLERTDIFNQHIQHSLFNCSSDEDITLNQKFFFLKYDTAVAIAIAAFERIYDIDEKSKWAYCFDELELAPNWLQTSLFTSLRSRNQKFLYKLSASPIVSISASISATPGNDLKLVKMWPHMPGKKYETFSQTLVDSILQQRIEGNVSADTIFGSNQLLRTDQDNDYDKGGATWNEIKELGKTDETLKELLDDNGIDSKNPIVTNETKTKLDTVLRKIKPIVYFRNFYSVFDSKSNKRIARSRKASTLFYGKEVIYKICDGNPRWLIGIVNEMLSKKKKLNHKTQIKPADQAAVLRNVANQFNNVIKTIPEAMVESKGKIHTLSGLLKEIGDHFFNEIVIDDFKKDPHSTFVIDDKIDEEFVKILEKGVYQGAIVLVDPSENAFDFEMRNKRFRLSYMYCPIFKIPIRKYSQLPLSKILTEKETIVKHSNPELPFN